MRGFFSNLKLTLAGFVLTAGSAFAQSETPATLPMPQDFQAAASALADVKNPVDPNVKQASGCCGMRPRGDYTYGGGCGSGGCGENGHCVPGRYCVGCNPDTVVGRLMGCFYDELCCPDPCYEPRWIPAANAAFFQDSPRPVTQTRIHWDRVVRYTFPDSAEFFWAKIGGRGPSNATPGLSYNELGISQEIAAKGASIVIDVPYRSIDPVNNPSASGFSDMNIAVKTVILDRDLLLITMQMKTFIPVGNSTNGLGTGHASIEPSLLSALKITHSTYLQTQLAEWIPLGGTSGFEGSVFHFHASLNQNLCKQGDCFNMVGTIEMNGFSMRGQYTDFPSGTAIGLGGRTYLNFGPGLRVQFCENVDFGFGAAFGVNNHGPSQFYRTELRIRF